MNYSFVFGILIAKVLRAGLMFLATNYQKNWIYRLQDSRQINLIPIWNI